MTVSIQIRNVPIEVRDKLARAAKHQGQSMQSYLLRLLSDGASSADQLARLKPPPEPTVSVESAWIVDTIREGRDAGFESDRAGY